MLKLTGFAESRMGGTHALHTRFRQRIFQDGIRLGVTEMFHDILNLLFEK